MTTQIKLQQACQIAQSAGDIALKYFRQDLSIENKLTDGNFDPVTQADKEVEVFIRAQLSRAYPHDGILGEEQAETLGESDYRWVIDPIDGTRAFMTGIPLWGILMGLQKHGQAVAGLMYQPFTGELFFGEGDCAQLKQNGEIRRLKTSSKTRLEDANLYTTTVDTFTPHPGALGRFEALAKQVQLCRFGGDCYSYCLLAMGQVDVVIDGSLQAYDIVPLIPIIEAAGGIVTNWQGEDASNGGLIIAAANAELHAKALGYLKNSN